jgi:hypothetical protein
MASAMAMVALIAGIGSGYRATKDRKELCNSIAHVGNKMTDFINLSQKHLENQEYIQEEYVKQTNQLYVEIAQSQNNLAQQQKKFKLQYSRLQVILILSFVVIGISLYLKHNGIF